MSRKKRRAYSPEFKDGAVQMVLANSGKVAPVARDFGINEQTLRNWVNAHHQRVPDSEPPLTMNERARLRELERENIELR
ncbi:MAG TPA: transposase, partial [Candidatus Stackebrandtia excrementipullorum]|nr:transposase [Candidatus Stackebrandtia excrementipullorum]